MRSLRREEKVTVNLLLAFLAGLCFALAALSALLPIPHPLPLVALGLLFQLAAAHVPVRVA